MVEETNRTEPHQTEPLLDAADAEQIQQDDPEPTTAQQTLQHKVELLQRGRTFLLTVPSYTAKLSKQEVVKGELLDEQMMLLKCRHKPFSVYLKWLTTDAGREVIYAEGANDGKLTAHDGGWKSRLPAFSVSPDSWIAMRNARYPVTAAGVLALIDIMDGIHADDLARASFASCEQTIEHFDGRPCHTFTMLYKNRELSPIYRKSITMIDQEWNVPLSTRHFEWPRAETAVLENQLDEATLIESYAFTELAFDAPLTDQDFDPTNAEYQFR
ncbi:MAG: DUF1571 domain-containing protein [Planctomycetota bacterium]